jgi:hypothetical protein
VYVAHDAENLQFYLWLIDYTKRFDALPEDERRLSPAWRAEDRHAKAERKEAAAAPDDSPLDMGAFFAEAGHTSVRRSEDTACAGPDHAARPSPAPRPPAPLTPPAVAAAQPFRAEIALITSHYLTPGAPRELNLSHRDRATLLHALAGTTHPTAFAPIRRLLALTLRNHSHVNFVRWTLCNGNAPRVLVLRTLAVAELGLAVLLAVLLTLSRAPRLARLGVAPLVWLGTVSLVAAHRGLCILLFRRRTRELHPWELDRPGPGPAPPAEAKRRMLAHMLAAGGTADADDVDGLRADSADGAEKGVGWHGRAAPLGPGNGFADEAWVGRWRGLRWWQLLRLRKVWVRDEGARIMQNRIVRQAHAWAVLVTLLAVGALVALPAGDLF